MQTSIRPFCLSLTFVKSLNEQQKIEFFHPKYSNQAWHFALFSANLVFRGTFHFKSFQSTKRWSDSRTNVPWNFISRRTAQRQLERFCVRQSLPESTRERVSPIRAGACTRRPDGGESAGEKEKQRR